MPVLAAALGAAQGVGRVVPVLAAWVPGGGMVRPHEVTLLQLWLLLGSSIVTWHAAGPLRSCGHFRLPFACTVLRAKYPSYAVLANIPNPASETHNQLTILCARIGNDAHLQVRQGPGRRCRLGRLGRSSWAHGCGCGRRRCCRAHALLLAAGCTQVLCRVLSLAARHGEGKAWHGGHQREAGGVCMSKACGRLSNLSVPWNALLIPHATKQASYSSSG